MNDIYRARGSWENSKVPSPSPGSLPYTIASKAEGEEKEPELLEDAELPA